MADDLTDAQILAELQQDEHYFHRAAQRRLAAARIALRVLS